MTRSFNFTSYVGRLGWADRNLEASFLRSLQDLADGYTRNQGNQQREGMTPEQVRSLIQQLQAQIAGIETQVANPEGRWFSRFVTDTETVSANVPNAQGSILGGDFIDVAGVNSNRTLTVALSGVNAASTIAGDSGTATVSGVNQTFNVVGAGGIVTSATGNTITIDGSAFGTGDVVGPASSTDLGLVFFDGTTGKIIRQYGPVRGYLDQPGRESVLVPGTFLMRRGGTTQAEGVGFRAATDAPSFRLQFIVREAGVDSVRMNLGMTDVSPVGTSFDAGLATRFRDLWLSRNAQVGNNVLAVNNIYAGNGPSPPPLGGDIVMEAYHRGNGSVHLGAVIQTPFSAAGSILRMRKQETTNDSNQTPVNLSNNAVIALHQFQGWIEDPGEVVSPTGWKTHAQVRVAAYTDNVGNRYDSRMSFFTKCLAVAGNVLLERLRLDENGIVSRFLQSLQVDEDLTVLGDLQVDGDATIDQLLTVEDLTVTGTFTGSVTAAQISDASAIGRDVLTASDAAAIRGLVVALGGSVGLLSARPADSAASGLFYYATDTNELFYSDGSTWTLVNDTGSSFDPSSPGPIGDVTPSTGEFTDLTVTGTFTGSVTSTQISDSTSVGRDVLTAADAEAARTAIGAGTSDFDPAAPGAIGGTTPGSGDFTTLGATGNATVGGTLGVSASVGTVGSQPTTPRASVNFTGDDSVVNIFTMVGFESDVTFTNASTVTAIRAVADGSYVLNIGLFASAQPDVEFASPGWAGYFADGNVKIENNLEVDADAQVDGDLNVDGDVVADRVRGGVVFDHRTSNYNPVQADSGKHFTNKGATGGTIHRLGNLAEGTTFVFQRVAAHTINILVSSGNIVAPDGNSFYANVFLDGGVDAVRATRLNGDWHFTTLRGTPDYFI